METKKLVEELKFLLRKGNAHMPFEEAVADLSEELCGTVPDDLPYSVWQLAEHIRITQKDILEFCRDPQYQSPEWPKGYWPENAAPQNDGDLEQCLKDIEADRETFIALLEEPDADLFTPFEHGNGQTLLREALLIADHTAYHTGQIIVVRRLLNAWG